MVSPYMDPDPDHSQQYGSDPGFGAIVAHLGSGWSYCRRDLHSSSSRYERVRLSETIVRKYGGEPIMEFRDFPHAPGFL